MDSPSNRTSSSLYLLLRAPEARVKHLAERWRLAIRTAAISRGEVSEDYEMRFAMIRADSRFSFFQIWTRAGSASGTTVALQRSPPTACTCGFTFPKLRRHASDKPPRRASVPLKHQECKNQRHSVAHFTARKPPRSEIGCLFARRRSKASTLRVSPFPLRLARTTSLIYKP